MFPIKFSGGEIVLVQAPKVQPRLTRVGEFIRLLKVLEQLRFGALDMDQFEPLLQVAMQEQKAKVEAMLAGLGKITAISFVGPQNDGHVYKVTFENGVLAWWISIAASGKIAGLRVIPADAPRH